MKFQKQAKERVNMLLSPTRKAKLRIYAFNQDLTMTQAVERWIDSLNIDIKEYDSN